MNISEQFSTFSDLLYEAVPNIGEEFMRFEAVGLMDGFMERTYAYELYHQLRRFQDEHKYNDFTIHAEPEKQRTDFLHSILERLGDEKLRDENTDDFQKRVMPDLLVHVPKNVNANIAIVEIKPEKGTLNRTGIRKDVRVLKEFVNGGRDVRGYFRGILLLYSTTNGYRDRERIIEQYSAIIKETIGDSWQDYAEDITLLWHTEPGSKPGRRILYCSIQPARGHQSPRRFLSSLAVMLSAFLSFSLCKARYPSSRSSR